MLQVRTFEVNPLGENCYVVYDAATRRAAVVDAGAYREEERREVEMFVDREALRVDYLLQTHAHFDHLFGVDRLSRRYGLLPRCHEADLPLYAAAGEQMLLFMHRDLGLVLPEAGAPLHEGDVLPLGGESLRVIHTPGHTPGGICLYAEASGFVFTGDSLFRRSVGRCDLPGGDAAALVRSLCEKILTLPDSVIVFPGHGPQTSIGEERRENPYLAV